MLFFFSSRRRHTRWPRDWSSDVCSSDLMNVKTNSLGFKLSLAFAQTSPSKDVQDYMLEGKDIAQKHMKKFADILLNDSIQMPHSPDVGVTNSTTQTFSYKFMMFLISVISAASIGYYEIAASFSHRL